MTLSDTAPGNLSPQVARPGYDRSALTHGIVHVGLGNFHRAHQAVYLDDLFALGEGHDWAITGAGVRAPDAAMREVLLAQDCLSTVIELDETGARARIVGSMIDFLPVEEGNGALIAKMADAATRIVSLTVTEGGYFVSAETGTFDPTHPEIRADAARSEAPHTVFGAIVAALKQRRAAGIDPFTVMSCDNLPGNGEVTRDAVVGFAQLVDLELADWIEGQVAFPNGMVDRITPATGARERALAGKLGLDDPVPVTCEPFRQWVLEDNFPLGRPALEKVGVTFTSDVHTYERMKIRILNGGHALIAYPAALLGVELAHEAMAHPLVHGFFRKVEAQEILPHVHPVPEFDPESYLDLIDARFSNPAVEDTTRRLCLDGSNRQPKFIVPSIRDGLEAGTPVEGLALISALWARYCQGVLEDGTPVAPNDPNWQALVIRAGEAKLRPAAWLEMRDVYGGLGENPRFAGAFAKWFEIVNHDGVAAALEAFID
ncbi:mannitol 2-dehydrogenase [Pseudooceanicola antarcticus]|uniref:Mannitol 2-dehydrogenase n=1 Tax=Pseudooceanicola antarcticus TaxID=1247613 RepID=A0A285IVW6_9RHOB|nr:mannitol dehydrogenase family protein [Pseudooceanicola antarcticus]PJE26007.1 mannitol dehydrogenase family protein [Pseudooceanicola antarcticus]SNY52122.1 mannitol 2-dehydrogenase [Pseudooceanicola antarcticus]